MDVKLGSDLAWYTVGASSVGILNPGVYLIYMSLTMTGLLSATNVRFGVNRGGPDILREDWPITVGSTWSTSTGAIPVRLTAGGSPLVMYARFTGLGSATATGYLSLTYVGP